MLVVAGAILLLGALAVALMIGKIEPLPDPVPAAHAELPAAASR